MIRTLSISCLLGALLALAVLVPRAAAAVDTPFSVYRDAEMETRRQAEPELLHVPAADKEMMATTRAQAAVRTRDLADLAAAARDLVVHAPEGIAAGWVKAARFWEHLYRSSKAFADHWNRDWQERNKARRVGEQALREAAYSLYSAYRASSDPGYAGESLAALSSVHLTREEYVAAELALVASLAVREDPEAEISLKRIRHEHGFRVLEVRILEDLDDPMACLALSAVVTAGQREVISDYLVLEPDRGDHPVELRESTVCMGNLEHGAEYTLTLRDGLIDVHGRAVVPDKRQVRVPDRRPSAKFSGGRYVLPAIGSAGIPLTTVNMKEVPLTLLRITAGDLVDEVTRGRVGSNLGGYELNRIVDALGERLWQGTVSVREVRNREVVTAVPIDTLMPERKPGVYLLAVARPPWKSPAGRNGPSSGWSSPTSDW